MTDRMTAPSAHRSPASDFPPGRETGGGRRLRLLFLLPIVVFAGLALVFLVRLFGGDPSKVPSALIGRPAPAFVLEPLPGLKANGEAVPGLSDADLRAGTVTVVNVWGSWCPPCRQEHPTLMELSKDRSFRLVGIDLKDNPDNARRFLGELGNPFSALGVDPAGRTAIDWGVYGAPETFVISRDGIIRYKHIGPLLPQHMPAFLAQVKAAGR
jgi:cytochrome c biogenesis protein CcmG, thiol:disulfide interchange protein DsbE